MRRRVARYLFVGLCGILASLLGTATALVFTMAGHRALGDLLSAESGSLIRGSFTLASISGIPTGRLRLERVRVQDTAGVLLADLPSVEVDLRYSQILARRIVLDRVLLRTPVIRLRKHRGGRMNFQEVLRLGEGEPGKSSPLIEFRNVSILGGDLEIRTPWDPDSRLRTPAQADSALAAEREKPGRIIESEPDGLMRVRRIQNLTLVSPRLRIATPAGDPLLADLATLSGRLNDPGIDLRAAQGQVITGADTLHFDLPHIVFPATLAKGAGRVSWPRDTVLFDFALQSDTVSLEDFRWVSPNFPAMHGRGTLTALSRNGLQTDYEIRGLSLRDDVSAIDGSLVAVSHRTRGLGWRNLAVALRNFDLDLARPFLDTLPFHGQITGTLRANGFPGSLGVELDWTFEDAAVATESRNRIVLAGRVRLGGEDGIAFDSTQVTAADLSLPTIRQLAPALRLDGRLGLGGILHGPMRNATFWGTVEHRVEQLAPSVLVGRLRLDTRGEEVGLDADVDLTPLMFAPLRRTFPDLPTQGALTGRVHLNGGLAALFVDLDVQGDLGAVRGRGTLTLTPPRWGVDSLAAEFVGLDLARAIGRGDPTSLTGSILLTGLTDSATVPVAQGRLELAAGRISSFAFDSASFRGALRDTLLTVDTVQVRWDGGAVEGAGSLGWMAPHEGTLIVSGTASSLMPFDSLFHRLSGIARDTAAGRQPLEGRVRGAGAVVGALDRLRATAQFAADSLAWERVSASTGRALVLLDRVGADSGATTRIDVQGEVDSLSVGRFVFPLVQGVAAGDVDSLRWSLHGDGVDDDLTHVATTGRWRTEGTGAGARRAVGIDSLSLRLASHTWRLVAPTELLLGDSGITIDSTHFAATDGSGAILIAGAVPGQAEGDLSVQALGIGFPDLYSLLQRDTTGVAGSLSLDADVTGTAASPRLRGTASLTGTRFGDFRAPFANGAFFYADRTLAANLNFWRTGTSVLEVEGQVPLDLAFRSGITRQIPGNLAIRARADSMDLGVLEAFSPNIRRVVGSLDADVTVLGGWEAPELGGEVRIHDGGLLIPGLGVGYGPINGQIHLAGDSILVDTLRIYGDGAPNGLRNAPAGWLDVTGGVRLVRLTRPVLGLTLTAEQFQIMDLPDFLRLRANLDLRLQGSSSNPVLTGAGTARNSVLYFSDLITKNIVNLEDPLNRDLVDTLALQRGLGAAFQSRFLDSLRITRFTLRAAEDVWLRSSEANIQLQGEVVVDKVGRRGYRVNGAFNAPRGTYTLKMGPVTRDFQVTRGSVRYFGTPDLDAELDLEARHLVRSIDPDLQDLPIIARISGTLLDPTLRLETTSREPLSQSDLAGILVFGQLRPAFSTNLALETLTSALSSEVSRTLVQSGTAGAPNLFEIRPGSSLSTGQIRGLTQVVAGWQIGTRWFVTFNAGFCGSGGGQAITYQNFGASLEYRLTRDLSAQASAEPVQFCGTNQILSLRDRGRYQFGADLRWDRSY